METGLAIVSTINAVTFFQPGSSVDILEKLKVEVRAEAAKLDISTNAGRKAIASLSNKVCKTKTGLEAAGKELVSDEKKRIKLVDEERGKVWDELQYLQDEVRQPLTDWEEADGKRCAALEFKVVTMSGLATLPFGATAADIEARIAEADGIDLTNMQEFTSRAELAERQTRYYLSKALAEAQQREAEKAETIRLRAEAAEREKKENEERIAREAREKAQREAEEERNRIEQEKFQAEARAKQAEAARIAAEEQAERDAKSAAERHAESLRVAEVNRVAAEARAKQEAEDASKRHAEEMAKAEERRKLEAKVAEEVAENRRLAAIEAEREKVAAEARRVAAETEAREKDKKHKSKIMGAAKDALIAAGIPEEHAKATVLAIQHGKVPAVSIAF